MGAKKKFLLWLMAVMLLFAILPLPAAAERDLPTAPASVEQDFPAVLAEAKKGVVQIYGLADDGRYLVSWIGSGFAVGKEGEDSDIFLTNWHVVTGEEYSLSQVRLWILQENCSINERTLEPDPSRSITCKVLKTTTGYPDYAIIQATESVSGYKALPLLSSEDVLDGATVYALGFPAVVGDASASHYGINDITSTDGIISQHMQYTSAGNTWVLMHTAQISGGNSGGPLITQDGAVVGLNTYGFGEYEGNLNRYCAVYIDYAIEGLEDLGISFDLYSGSSGGGGETDEKQLLIIGAGAVILIAAAGTVYYILQTQKKAQQLEWQRQEERRRLEEEHRRQEEARRLQEEERRRQEEEERRRQEAQLRQKGATKATLRMNGGQVYPIRAAGGTVGRDKSCIIVLPENASGVSRIHCRLEFRGEQLVLTDLNSSYGTIIHGKRIPPNTPVALKTGSSFSLGSEKYTFTVC